MTSNLAGIKSCCLSGHLHKGDEAGKVEEFAGLSTYVTGSNASKTIVVIPDIFGYELKNIRLLADEYAKTGGFRVIIPDFFKGDWVDVSHMKALTPLKSDPVPENKEQLMGAAFGSVGPWLERHGDEVVQPLIHGVISALRADSGVTSIGVMGICWGGRQALHLMSSGVNVDAVLANHPSYTELPAVFEGVNKPCLIQIGDDDAMFPPEQWKEVKDTIFPAKKDAEILVYPGAVHGFTNRSDQNNAEETKLKDDAAEKGISFFQKYLV